MHLFNSWTSFLLSAGVVPSNKDSTVRAIRISNLVILSAILNTIAFALIFYLAAEYKLSKTSLIVAALYTTSYLINFSGRTKLGRSLAVLSGNLVVFYFASVFRGSIGVEFLYFSLSVVPLMFFGLREKIAYILISLSVFLFIFGEYYSWNFFEAYVYSFDPKWIKIFSIFATIHQIIAGFYYFLLQSSRYESESRLNLEKLEIEYRKQIQVQKMSSLGEMAAGISHEINNPLMVVLGKSYQIRRKLNNPDALVLDDIDKIEEMVHRMSKIVRALKNFSRNADEDPTETINLKPVIELTLDLCSQRFYTAGIELKVDIADGLYINCRPTEISQVLLNLLNNAFDAVQDIPTPEITIKAFHNGSTIEILIQDNGKGIKLEIQDKIMQPFFTTKEIGKGTGLGLSISKGIIESHHGSLALLQNKNVTCFQIQIPEAT